MGELGDAEQTIHYTLYRNLATNQEPDNSPQTEITELNPADRTKSPTTEQNSHT